MKICIIEDEQKELKKLSEYVHMSFENKDKWNNIETELVFLQSTSSTEVKKCTPEEQKKRIIRTLEAKWKECDVFLIDIAMLGVPLGYPIVSIEAVKDFLETYPDYKKEYQIKKFIVFVTNHWMLNTEFDGEIDFIQKIIKINKKNLKIIL